MATTSMTVQKQLREDLNAFLADPARQNALSQEDADAFRELLSVLQTSRRAVIFPSDKSLTTGEAAAALGVSRMTVVRLIDRGALRASTEGTHRRITALELQRYREDREARQLAALHTLGEDITDDTPPDRVIKTR
ncbi:helix-turn-helix domain-containing protein [Falsarthrobacter nasiphocae]|uniref:Excisionase family DNA binding protein n=1 Tax=Falsarthrobacter nasiphocae TaxID=189863 RepID=A0AAE3YI70_9MICC|nr:helix-turn-helix domain-containing protein [Falsarthrobacter nasiphocae]MDR6892393.1 excisionase family DNA binding protein [Falsarthrobacter nasiphocae]